MTYPRDYEQRREYERGESDARWGRTDRYADTEDYREGHRAGERHQERLAEERAEEERQERRAAERRQEARELEDYQRLEDCSK